MGARLVRLHYITSTMPSFLVANHLAQSGGPGGHLAASTDRTASAAPDTPPSPPRSWHRPSACAVAPTLHAVRGRRANAIALSLRIAKTGTRVSKWVTGSGGHRSCVCCGRAGESFHLMAVKVAASTSAMKKLSAIGVFVLVLLVGATAIRFLGMGRNGMGLFDRIRAAFSKKEKAVASPQSSRSAQAQETDDEMIEVYDGSGRHRLVPREEWRNNVLPGKLQSEWDQPDGLYMAIVAALHRWRLTCLGRIITRSSC